MHHHVALDNVGDAERLYRFINGTALGLIAPCGGAYCAAHIGLLQLVQSGITFDIMGGTSGGAAMTAGFAMGAHPDDVDRATHDIRHHRAMRRWTRPRLQPADHTNYDRQLAKYYSGVDIEDLWIPYFCVSTNLSSYDLHRHRHGDLWAAVRASGSIPVLLPPLTQAAGMVGRLDGLIISGGPDVEPAAYGEQPGPNTTAVRPERDAAELTFFRQAIAAGLPPGCALAR
jgi:NTE family protein